MVLRSIAPLMPETYFGFHPVFSGNGESFLATADGIEIHVRCQFRHCAVVIGILDVNECLVVLGGMASIIM